jgi:hypothetical protein
MIVIQSGQEPIPDEFSNMSLEKRGVVQRSKEGKGGRKGNVSHQNSAAPFALSLKCPHLGQAVLYFPVTYLSKPQGFQGRFGVLSSPASLLQGMAQ